MKRAVLVIAAIVVLGVVLKMSIPNSQVQTANFVGRPMPKFVMRTLDGTAYRNENFLGSVVLIDFWATWCGPCKQASAVMQSLHQKFVGRGLRVLGADIMEHGDNIADSVRKYQREHNYSYIFLTGGDGLSTQLAIGSIPYAVLVDRHGTVRAVFDGFYDGLEKEAEGKILPLLDEH